jgi:hypothetical protein
MSPEKYRRSVEVAHDDHLGVLVLGPDTNHDNDSSTQRKLPYHMYLTASRAVRAPLLPYHIYGTTRTLLSYSTYVMHLAPSILSASTSLSPKYHILCKHPTASRSSSSCPLHIPDFPRPPLLTPLLSQSLIPFIIIEKDR